MLRTLSLCLPVVKYISHTASNGFHLFKSGAHGRAVRLHHNNTAHLLGYDSPWTIFKNLGQIQFHTLHQIRSVGLTRRC